AKARADLERLAASGALTMLGGGGMWIVMTAFMAEVAAAVRSVPAAEILYEALRPFGAPPVDSCGAGATHGPMGRQLALQADVLCCGLIPAAEGVGLGQRPSSAEAAEAGLSTARRSGEDVIDERAREAYKARLADLQEDVEDAERANDPERAARARAELDFL